MKEYRCFIISVIAGNISAGKTTLGNFLSQKLENSIFIEEKFKELTKLPLYYEESHKNQNNQSKHNKYALDLQLEFLGHRYDNEMFRNKIQNKNLILDRCIFEDYHIFTKTQLELGFLIRNFIL